MTVDAPQGLADAGRALWDEITANFELEQHEVLLLREACRLADRLDELAEITAVEGAVLHHGDKPVVHPAAVEQRQVALALTRVVASLRLPAGEEDGRPQRRGAARGAYGIRGLAG